MAPPQAGFLWTPGYWGFSEGLYSFNAGYWGPTVGFYGGVNYGFGYGGSGFDGGRWQNGHFAYNTAVSRVNTTVIHNTYNQNVTNNGNRTSFNGGPGGIGARPSSAEASTAREHNQPASAPATTNRGAEPQSRLATRPSPSSAKPSERPAVNTRVAPLESPRASRPQARQVASNRSDATPTRPAAPQQRPRETHAAVPVAARPQARASAPRHPAEAKPADGKEERR